MNRKRKRIVFALNALLALGLLAYSIIFLVINRKLNPASLGGDRELTLTRLFWRGTAEKICGACIGIYLLGHFWLLCRQAAGQISVGFRTIVSYFMVQLGLIAACTVPFALLDTRQFFWDHLYPIWRLAELLLIFLLLSRIIICFRKQ